MPSPLVIPVAPISNLRPHPNADTLDIAQVLGWQVVVKRGQYTEGQLIVYFPPDTLLPKELSDAWGVTEYLHHQRVRAVRLRGEPSFGLVMASKTLDWEEGQNVAEHFPGVEKYEAPLRTRHGVHIDNPHGLPSDSRFPQYTHIQNLRHYPSILDMPEDDLFAEQWIVTEKLHGTNSRIGMIEGEWMAGSHKVRRGESDELYWSPKEQVERLVKSLARHHKQVVVYGEIVGDAVQSLDYGYEGYAGYYVFDILVDGRFLDVLTVMGLCESFFVPFVPVLGVTGITMACAERMASGSTTIVSLPPKRTHMREGIVIRPLVERTHPKIGRLILKYVSNEYLLAKEKNSFTDYAEV